MVKYQKRPPRTSAPNVKTDKQHSGIGLTLPQVILGRVVSGVGGAGMTAIVSILITGNCYSFAPQDLPDQLI